ncbi:MAG TPA: type III PLP-dependent enzyme [Stellaceae bacterium]|nr:type III PLP-dependent enzyme [Stellaceae bacterium]
MIPVTERIERFLKNEHPPSPFIVIDLDLVRASYRQLRELLPAAAIYYAVKANPAPAVVAALAELGAGFDLASAGEIERCRKVGVPFARCSFGNTIKKEQDIALAAGDGIDLFAFDSAAELEKLGRLAPGARVFCRLAVENAGSQWPLTRKFGCSREMAIDLLLRARAQGLRPAGISFHVGSQQTDPRAWAFAIADAAGVFRVCAKAGVELELLNLGGGLPAQYRTPVPLLSAYAEAIESALAAEFGNARPHLLIEPGRYLVGDAGLLRSTVLLIAVKSRYARRRWVYLDAGRYNGLPETLGERIQYRLRTPRDGGPDAAAALAGPSCDSTDILYQHSDYHLPLELAIGDPIDFLSAGAYTASYASVEFNGFAPIQTYCI